MNGYDLRHNLFFRFLVEIGPQVGKNPGRYFDLCVYSYFFCQYGRWHQCSVKIYIYSERVLPQKGWKKKNKQAVSGHHVFRVQWSPCPPTLWGTSRTSSSPPSWGTHAPHRAPPPNGWTTSVLLPVHETQNGPHQRCIHLSLWWPLRQMLWRFKQQHHAKHGKSVPSTNGLGFEWLGT